MSCFEVAGRDVVSVSAYVHLIPNKWKFGINHTANGAKSGRLWLGWAMRLAKQCGS